MIDLSEAIAKNIARGIDYIGRKYFYWSLPRMIGATSFLTNLANIICEQDKRVLYISHLSYNNFRQMYSSCFNTENFEYRSFQNLTNINYYRGKIYDIILIDGERIKNEHRSMLENIVKEYILHLETTDG